MQKFIQTTNNIIKSNERIDDLQRNGLRIIQDPDGFCFGMDAVLLSSFVSTKNGSTIVDLGTGTGIIPILLSAKTKASTIYGLEIQSTVADMAKRSIILNHLEQKVHIIHSDLKNALQHIQANSVDVVTTNPPYMKMGTGAISPTRSVSRHEIMCSLEDVISIAYKLLKPKGKFFMVHRSNRLVDIMYTLRKYHLEPKLLQCVHPFKNKDSNLVLIEARKDAGQELKILSPLIIRDANGEYTEKVYELYNNAGIDNFG